MTSRTINGALIAIALGMVPMASEARRDGQKEGKFAKEHYDLGNSFYSHRKFDLAIQEFNIALSDPEISLNQKAWVLWNITRAQEEMLGKAVGGIEGKRDMTETLIESYQRAITAFEEVPEKKRLSAQADTVLACRSRLQELRANFATFEEILRAQRASNPPPETRVPPTLPPPPGLVPPAEAEITKAKIEAEKKEAIRKAEEEERRRDLERTIQGNPPIVETPSWPKRHIKSLAIGGGAVVLGIVSAALIGSAVANHADYSNGEKHERMAIGGIVIGGLAIAAGVAALVVGLKYESAQPVPKDAKLELAPRVVNGKVVDGAPAPPTAKK